MIRYKARCNGLSGNRTHYGRPLAARWMNSLRERGLTSVNTKEGRGDQRSVKDRLWKVDRYLSVFFFGDEKEVKSSSPTSQSCGPQSRQQQVINFKMKLYSTCASPLVPHASTGHAHGCLASEIGRDPAFPTRFDRTVDSPEVSLLTPGCTCNNAPGRDW